MGKNSKAGRPSKGPRYAMTTRFPLSYKPKIEQWAARTGETQSDLVAELVMQHLDEHDPGQADGQQELIDLHKIA